MKICKYFLNALLFQFQLNFYFHHQNWMSSVSISSTNGLTPNYNNPLAEPMFIHSTHIYAALKLDIVYNSKNTFYLTLSHIQDR